MNAKIDTQKIKQNIFEETYSKSTYALVIICCVMVLCVIGLLMIYSVTSATNAESGHSTITDVAHQFAYILAGVVVAIFLARYKNLFDAGSYIIVGYWILCLILVGLVAVVGVSVNGATRWLSIGNAFTIQPSEFLKIALVLMIVQFLANYRYGTMTALQAAGWIGVTVVLPLVFLFLTQRDMGTTLVCCATLLALCYLAGVDNRLLLAIIAVGVVGVLAIIFLGGDFRSGRMVFLNPWDDGEDGYGSGYNLIRAFYAISSGGLFGVGIGNSHEKYDYLYAADNDFIFAVICEEMGLLGGLLVIACIGAIFFCCIKIAETETEIEAKLIVYGCGLLLVIQSCLNIGSTVGALPTTGKPLPFVSSGGSSVLASFIVLGIILNAVTHEKVQRREDIHRQNIEVLSDSGRTRSTISEHTARENLRERRASRDATISSRTRTSSTSSRRSSTSRSSRGSGEGRDFTSIDDPSFLDKRKRR